MEERPRISEEEDNKVSSSEDEDISDYDDDYYFGDDTDEDSKQYNGKNDDYTTEYIGNRTNDSILQGKAKEVNENIVYKNNQEKKIANPLKVMVSKQKKRFVNDGYNLDLSYITGQIIAMGYPASSYESIYRNSMVEVRKFFQDRHPNHYRVYNLCEERRYDFEAFEGNVKEYPFEDHQAPQFKLIYEFCKDLQQWLNDNPKNVAGIHCKAGKGRTGVMICCYLLYDKTYNNAYDALKFYSLQRTKNQKGVTIPSQIRYVLYFERALQNNWKRIEDIPRRELEIRKIRLFPVPQFNIFGGCEPWCKICWDFEGKSFQKEAKIILKDNQEEQKLTSEQGKNQQDNFQKKLKKKDKEKKFRCYMSTQENSLKAYKSEPAIEYKFDNLKVFGDVYISFFNNSVFKKGEKMFAFWFNCDFFDSNGKMVIDKPMLDRACKDKKNKKFSKDFQIEIYTVNSQNIQENSEFAENNTVSEFNFQI